MPFKKGNKLGAKKELDFSMDPSPLCLKVRIGVKERIKTVPNWQAKVRKSIDELIERDGRKPQD